MSQPAANHHAFTALEPVDIDRRYKFIRPRPQQPNFAARIDGVDLTRPLTPEVRRGQPVTRLFRTVTRVSAGTPAVSTFHEVVGQPAAATA